MPEKPDSTGELLENLLRGLAKKQRGEQAIVAVETGDRSFHWIGAAGRTAAGTPAAEDTPFFIASIDKLYNAVIAMLLRESGRLELDQSIRDFLPDNLTRGLHRYRGRDRAAEITVRHLLTHTSGLADWLEDYPRGGESLAAILFREGDRALSTEEILRHVGERLTPHFPPQDPAGKRAKVRYSDTNFILLAEIIEAVAGRPLPEVHRRMLYEPLGLRQTWFPGHSRPLAPVPSPMVLRVRGRPLGIPLLIRSIKGIYGTASDLMAFLRHLAQGRIFRRPETLSAVMGGWRRFGVPMDRAALRAPGWPIEYGMGMMRFRPPRLLAPFSAMPAVYGHTGSTGCWLFYCPELDVLLSGSVEDVSAGPVPFRFVPAILKELSKAGWPVCKPAS